MPTELAKTYDPKSVEKEVYQQWLAAGAFHADPARGGPSFCMVIPPPNVTAALHVGHALNNALQDVLIRLRRMQQFNTLWMPGTDHAGIATQTVVEKRILAEEGKRRTDFTRDEFVARVQAWKDDYEARIIGQLRAMGCSCDWDRTRFTMDEVCAAAVRATFFKLFSDGLIYRGKRLVNWDPATQTVLADDEVEHEQVNGHFWYLQYPLVKPVEIDGRSITHVTVATTRPETMLGDTAIAMNPADPRAKCLVGKQVRLPIVGRLIPIIADAHVVLPNPESEDEKARFSTGFLKVTPAHDPDDYAIGQRHGLAVINVMAPDGSISDKHGWSDADAPEAQNLIGMDRFEARAAIVEFFRTEGLLEDVRDYSHQVGHSYRSHVPIEPYLSDQWYVAVKKEITPPPGPRPGHFSDPGSVVPGTDVPANSLAGFALAPLLDGRLKFTPDRYANTYRSWLENLRDWPISRQLWWGHQIPVWTLIIATGKHIGPGESHGHAMARHRSECTTSVDSFLRDCGIEDQFVIREGDVLVDGESPLYLASSNPKFAMAIDLLTRMLAFEGTDNLETIGQYRATCDRLLQEFPNCSLHAVNDLRRYIRSLTRDGDVLDTWFSSALWPFSTLGWPRETDALKRYYPGDVLCTAREIITLWVSRMVMMGQYCLGDIPFRDVVIHAMIQDGEGRKMSKSLGNGIDPHDIIDSHGADAMRFTLVSMTTQTQDVRMPVEPVKLPDGRTVNASPKFDIGRNFCNKLWNAARFAMMNLSAAPAWDSIRPQEDLADAWILSRMHAAVRDATRAAESFRFNELADTLYHFMWDDLCDWYLEIAKARINAGRSAPKAVLAYCLDVLLRLLHPITPFITETLWQALNGMVAVRGPGDEPAEPMLVAARWPMADAAMIRPAAEEQFALLRELIRLVRNARAEHDVPPRQVVNVAIEADGAAAGLITANLDLLKSLANVGEATIAPRLPAPPENAAAVTVAGTKLYVLDIIDRQAELSRLTKQAESVRKGVAGIEGKLGNANFVARAPAEVVAKERQRLERLRADLIAVEKALASLN
jgi:valyl-tRNA synthetase